MKKNNYNIFSKLWEEIDDFNNSTLTLAWPEKTSSMLRNLRGKQPGYIYSQREVLNLIDLYYNSKFEKGPYDSEGQRKLFLNISTFRADVASKQTAIKIANFNFIPDNYSQIKKTSFMQRKFQIWARENDYGETIDEMNDDYSKYGSVVGKRVGKKFLRVPLRTIIVSQDAKTLLHAATSGGYVIEEHEYTKSEMKKFKGWDIDGIIFDKKTGKAKVYERYGLCPENYIYEDGDEENMIFTMSILAPSVKDNKLQKIGKVIFKEEITEDDFPYDECHWKKQDGRWLGVGEIENQIENQIAKNFTANMRRRSILWGAKRVLQSRGDVVAKNLVKDVKDGEILQVGMNGEITKVDLSNPAGVAELNSDDAVWDKNSDQKSFTYEVATGEGMKSGTPFRLGILLSNAVASHFDKKRRKFGRFLERAFYNQIIDIFKKDTKEHTLQIANSTEDIDLLKGAMVEFLTGEKVVKTMLYKDKLIPREEAQAQVEEMVNKSPYLFFDIPDKFYDDAKFSMQLETAGNSENVAQDMETLTTIIGLAMKNTPDPLNNPIIRRLISIAVSKTGKNFESLIGNIKSPAPQPQPAVLPAGPVGNVPLSFGQQNINAEVK